MTGTSFDPFAGFTGFRATPPVFNTLASPFPDPPAIPTTSELYDSLMAKIEPELVTTMLPQLREKYAKETPEQTKARERHYNACFQEYYKQLAALLVGLHSQIHGFQKQVLTIKENSSRSMDNDLLSALESAMQNS